MAPWRCAAVPPFAARVRRVFRAAVFERHVAAAPRPAQAAGR